jgi:hypothetical protein
MKMQIFFATPQFFGFSGSRSPPCHVVKEQLFPNCFVRPKNTLYREIFGRFIYSYYSKQHFHR